MVTRRFKQRVYFTSVVLSVGVYLWMSVIFTRHLQHDCDDESAFSMKYRLKGPMLPDDEHLLEHVRERILKPPSTADYNLRINKTDGKSIEYNSYRMQHISWTNIYTQLKILFPTAGQRSRGFFVEAGAFDGEYIANTLYLELELGWSGLLIEPSKDAYDILESKHRKAWTCHCCLSAKLYPYRTVLSKMSQSPSDPHAGVMDHLIESKAVNERLAFGHNTFETVQCLPLQTILFALNQTHVDLISLDVEDVEGDVLGNFPWNDILVDVWIVEHRHPQNKLLISNDKDDYAFTDWFEGKGYTLYHISKSNPKDYIFIKRNSSYFSQNRERLQKHIIEEARG